MGTIDFISNLAGLILLLNWRSLRLDPIARRTPNTLVGTLRPAHPARFKGWYMLAAALGLVVLRAFIYWQIGSPADWTPKLHLGFVILPFRADSFPTALLYSSLSLLRTVILFVSWILALLVINARSNEDPVQRLLSLQLGPLGRCPAYVQAVIPPLLVLLAWTVLQPLLARLGVSAPTRSIAQGIEQGLLIAAALLFTLKYLVGGLLLLHLVNSYVYLGSNAFWEFISLSANNMLLPFRKVPLRTGKIDFAPVAAIVAVFLLLHTVPNLLTAEAARHRITIWPQ